MGLPDAAGGDWVFDPFAFCGFRKLDRSPHGKGAFSTKSSDGDGRVRSSPRVYLGANPLLAGV